MSAANAQQVEELILSSYEAMYRLAYSYVGNEDDAMDIVQESAYKAIKNAPTISTPQYLKTWLWRIVINTSVDCLRRWKKEASLFEAAEPTAEDRYTDFDTLEALNVLDERERSVIVLRFFEDRKLAEIAKILDLNINTIKSILYRSLYKLRLKLSEGDVAYEG